MRTTTPRLEHRRMLATAAALAALACTATVPGCGYLLRSPDRPTPAIHYRWAHDGARASIPCLFVLLPGILDAPDEFERRGLIADLHAAAPSCDLVAVAVHLYDYPDESIVERVHEDIVVVARERGYERVWLVGVSMGAVGAILTARAHPEDIDGLVLVSPYLGTAGFADAFVLEVSRHGGLASWARTTSDRPARIARVLHDPRPIWRWLAGYQIAPEAMPPLWIAYGRDDRFAAAQRLLADSLSPERCLVVEGRHDWETWRRLFHEAAAVMALATERPMHDAGDGGAPRAPETGTTRRTAARPRAGEDAW